MTAQIAAVEIATVRPLPVRVDVANAGSSGDSTFAPHMTQNFAPGCRAAPQIAHDGMGTA